MQSRPIYLLISRTTDPRVALSIHTPITNDLLRIVFARLANRRTSWSVRQKNCQRGTRPIDARQWQGPC